MSEPRTIKELRGFWMPNQVKARKFRMIEESELRAEAIKWIKSKNTGGFTFDIGMDGVIRHYKKKEKLNSIDYTNLGEMVGFINFFNITNEELI